MKNFHKRETPALLEGSKGNKPPWRSLAPRKVDGYQLGEPPRIPSSEALAYEGGPVVMDVVLDRFGAFVAVACAIPRGQRYTLSIGKQVLSGRIDSLIKTIERNMHLV